jgi:hypothetical protein
LTVTGVPTDAEDTSAEIEIVAVCFKVGVGVGPVDGFGVGAGDVGVVVGFDVGAGVNVGLGELLGEGVSIMFFTVSALTTKSVSVYEVKAF